MTDGVNAGKASDRFVVRWSLPDAAARPALEPRDGDELVPAERASRAALRDAWASGRRVAGMTTDGAYVLRA
jgi:predicted GNAT superfamily acetyltransferase